MWQLCICPLVSQFPIFKYILLLLVWPPLTLNHCYSGIQCRGAFWNVSLSNCLHCPFFPRPSLLFASQVCKSASSSQSCLPTTHFTDLISAGHSLSHTWHKLRSTNPAPKAEIITLLYWQEALVYPSESNVEQTSIFANRCNICFCRCLCASSVGVWMSLGLACAAEVCLRHPFMIIGRDKIFFSCDKKEWVWFCLHRVSLSCFWIQPRFLNSFQNH